MTRNSMSGVPSTMRPPPLPTNLAVDVVPVALRELVAREVKSAMVAHHVAMFVSGAAGVLLGVLVAFALRQAGVMP